jgi:hypothetical protein
VTRWTCASKIGVKEIPCQVFRPRSRETAEVEIEEQLIRGNLYRQKTQRIIAKEQRKLLDKRRVRELWT